MVAEHALSEILKIQPSFARQLLRHQEDWWEVQPFEMISIILRGNFCFVLVQYLKILFRETTFSIVFPNR